MNILITGGTGLFGSYLAKRLSQDNKIKIISRGKEKKYLTPQEFKRFNFTKCDIGNKGSLQKVLSVDIDLVIHCAGRIDIQNDGRCPEGIIETNLNSTIKLIEVMIEKGIKNLLFCSSMTVYGLNNRIPVKESSKTNPVHFYGISKKWAEEAIIAYAQQGLIKALIVRYPGFFGYPRKNGYIYNITKKLIWNKDILLDTTGLKFWESINIEDASRLTQKLIESWDWRKQVDIINCGYGEEVDFVKTAFRIKEILHSKSSINVKKPLGYVKFYLDNKKLLSIVKANYNFYQGLRNFVIRYKEWVKQ